MNPSPVHPERIAPDAWLVTELFPGLPGAHVPVQSLVLTDPCDELLGASIAAAV